MKKSWSHSCKGPAPRQTDPSSFSGNDTLAGARYSDPKNDLAEMVHEAECALSDPQMHTAARIMAQSVIDVAVDALIALRNGRCAEACAAGIAAVEAYERMLGALDCFPRPVSPASQSIEKQVGAFGQKYRFPLDGTPCQPNRGQRDS